MLGNKYTLEKLLEAEPTLKDKILSFFKGASTDYADVPKLSSAAKKYYKTYKKLFDEFSARNYESNANENTLFNTNNAAENTHLGTLFAKNAQKTPLTNINQEDMSVSGRDYAIVALENGNTYVTATRKVIKGTTRQEQRKEITHFFDVLLKDKPSLEIHTLEGDILTITKAETADKARDDYKNVNKQRIQLTDKEFAVKLNAESHIDELSEIARSEKKGKGKNDEKNHSFAQSGFTYRTAYFEDFDGQYYKITLSIGHNGQVATVYNVGKIEKNVPSSAKIIAVVGSKALDETFSDISIPQKSEKSNTFDKKTSGKQYALDIDSDDGNISGAEVMSWLNRRPESSDTSDAETKNLEQQKKSTEAKDHNIQSEIKGGIEVLVPTFENTKGNVARTVKQLYQDVSDLNVAPKNVMAIADKYFDRYDGSLSRSVMRIEFLKLAKILASESPEALDMGYDKSVSIAGELMMYEKDISGYTERIKEIKKHIRGINLKIHDQDKVGFDAFGGYGEFRKRNLGRLRLGKEGAEVDVVYAELRNTYGYDVFPEVNSIAEMVEIMAGIGDKIPEYVQPSDDFIESVQSTADSIFMRIGEAVAKGYPDKPKPQLSRKDAESYIKQLNAKYEVKFAKTKARLEAEADARAQSTINAERRAIEAERSRLNAEYRTDRVYNEKSIEERLYSKVEEFKYLKKDVKERLVRDLFLALNESNGAEWRKTVEIEFTVKIVDEILHNPNSNYNFTNPSDRRRLNTSVSKVVGDIAKIGRLSEAVKLEKRLKQEAKTEANARQRILTGIQQTLKKIDDKKKKRFMEASAYKSSEFGKTIETLTKMEWRSGFSSNIARDSMKVLSDWYTADNPMLFPPKNNENSFSKATAEYNPAISGRLKMLSEGEGEYTANELQALSDVLSYFTKLIDEYDKVYLEGKWQDGAELSKMLKKTIAKQEKMGVPIAIRAMRNKLLSTGFRTFGDALSVIKLADMYGDGIYTRYYNEWLQGEINADAEAMEIKSKYDEFMKGHRRYLKDAETETVNLHGQSVRKIDLISYAMTLKREQAWNSIVEGGVVFVDPKHENKVTLKPIKVEPGIGYKARLEAAMKAEQEAVMGMLNKTDIEYMTILEEGFELAKVAKTMGDMQRLGFINVIEGYYYPIKHAYTDHLTDFNTEIIATDRYAYASLNKSAIEEANSAIIIRSADTTFNSHIKGVTRYLYLSPVMDSFNKLYKLKATDMSLHRTIEESKTAWRHDGKLVGFDYLQNIMLDTMGMGKNVGDDFFAKIRGASVNFALGANPKVLVTQLSSLISSTSVLSGWSHVGAVGLWNGNIVDDYSVVAKLRDSDYTVAKAEGVIDRINTSTRIFTAGISLMDRFVVTRAWAACQVEVAKNGGPAVGTEDNRIAAGKLLDKVILETQQNSLTSRRTEGARRGNILTKSMQMYKSDAITLFGRVADGVGEVTYLRALLKNNSLADAERQSIETRLENAGKGLAKSVGAVVGNAVFMMLITEMFRNFYGKNDDETEEEKKNRIVLDAIGNLLSGMPIVSEIYSYFTSGYSLDSMEMSSINDFLDTAQKVIDYTEKKLEGKATERDGNKLVQDMLYGAGQLLGVPTRNMKNVAYGVVRLFSKDAAYKWDNALYKKSYSADLNEAVAKGDIGRATMIMELALKEKLGSGFSTGAISELTRLAGLGEKVTPSAIGNTITVNGEEFTLDADQYGAVRAEYDKVISATNDFIDSKFYKSLNDEQKAKALRKLYATYKDIAYDTVLGTNRNERAVIMSKLVKGDVLNAYLSLGVIESDKDAQGNTISGSKRAKVVSAINGLGVSVEQRLLLICASGYALKDGDIRGVTAEAAKVRLLKYILRMKGLTADERAEIAEMCGFEVKNGKIVNNFSKNLKKISSK